MTPQELLNAPRAEPQPLVSTQQFLMRDAQHRASCAPTPELRELWMRRYEQARDAK